MIFHYFSVVIKLNGVPRSIAKNGVHIINDYNYEITDNTVLHMSDYPYPLLGDLYRYPFGRVRVILPDGKERYLDTGNVSLLSAALLFCTRYLLNLLTTRQTQYSSLHTLLFLSFVAQGRLDWI